MKSFCVSMFLALYLPISHAQTNPTGPLDSFFAALQTGNRWMGSVAVFKGGRSIYTKSVGYSNVELRTAPNNATRYRIGSISKTFTTVLVLKAVEAGKLTLEQTLNNYFPTVPNADKITIGQLLSHRSGIHNFTNNSLYLTYNTQVQTEKEMIARIANGGSDFVPGSKADYSNSNFVLLSYVLQHIYKKPYATLLQEQIIKPLSLQRTAFGRSVNGKENESDSYQMEGNQWLKEKETDLSIPMGAGAVVSTPTDLCRFADALFMGKLVSATSLTQMKKIQDGYGMGLFAIPYNEKAGYGHTGGIDGFSAVFSYFPTDSLAVAIVSNGNNFSNNTIAVALLNWANGQTVTIPHFSHYTVSSANLDQYLGVYASKNFPLKITVTKEGDKLMTQATGQPAIEMMATNKNVFEFSKAGIVLTFKPKEKEMVLNQGGRTIVFVRE